VITFVLDSLIHSPGPPEKKKLERIFPAIPNFVPEHPRSAAYPPPREVHPDSREGTFPTATKRGLLTLILPT
jgi:hypothetical protein